MQTTPDSTGGKAVLTLAHVAGMVDMVALPVWVGTLMAYYRFSPPQAGLTVTLFLLGVVVSSLFFAPRFERLPQRAAASAGFAVGAVVFYLMSRQPVGPESAPFLMALHGLAGLGVGCALSFTHGSIGRSANPHRLFGLVNVTLGVFAVAFLGGVPQLVQRVDASMFFTVVAATMAVAALVTGLAFPRVGPRAVPVVTSGTAAAALPRPRLPAATWFTIGVVICLTMNQSMVFSFVERIGDARGFGTDRVNGVLIALGLVNLLPGALAALLQHRLSPIAVGMGGPIGQAVLALVMSGTLVFAPYAVAASLYVSMVIFTHTFLFGLLTRLDPSGRAVAATPAMMMIGSCIGPALGGAIVAGLGYRGLGYAACVITAVALLLMSQVQRRLRADGWPTGPTRAGSAVPPKTANTPNTAHA